MPSFKGRIKNFDAAKGFGFIEQEGGDDIHFRKSVIRSGQASVGASVEGDWSHGDKGLTAQSVRVLIAAAPAVMVKGFFSDAEKKNIRPELLCEEAEALAQELSGEKLNSSQLRRFFEEVRHLEKIVETKGFEVARPLIRMLSAKAHYAFGRQKIGQRFLRYLSDHAKSIKDQKDFDAFVKAFEAVVGYFYYFNPKKG
jgi:CRISPR type III-A-associated protein Csm2